MDELREEYTMLFNGISDTIHQLERMVSRLKVLQQKAEESYLLQEAAPLRDENTDDENDEDEEAGFNLIN